MGRTVGAPIRPKHNVPRPYHGPGEISSREAYKRQRKKHEKRREGFFLARNRTKKRGKKRAENRGKTHREGRETEREKNQKQKKETRKETRGHREEERGEEQKESSPTLRHHLQASASGALVSLSSQFN